MKLEVGKEYLYKGNRVKLVYVGKRGTATFGGLPVTRLG